METEILQQILNKLDNLEQGQSELKATVSKMQDDIEAIKDDVQITRAATDRLIDWAERSEKDTKVPLFRKQG